MRLRRLSIFPSASVRHWSRSGQMSRSQKRPTLDWTLLFKIFRPWFPTQQFLPKFEKFSLTWFRLWNLYPTRASAKCLNRLINPNQDKGSMVLKVFEAGWSQLTKACCHHRCVCERDTRSRMHQCWFKLDRGST